MYCAYGAKRCDVCPLRRKAKHHSRSEHHCRRLHHLPARANIVPKQNALLSKCVLFWRRHPERCLPLRASDVDFVSDVHCVSDVSPYGEVGKHHITLHRRCNTSLCVSTTSLWRSHNITLYKRSNFCYNITESEVILWQNLNSANYQWNSPLTSLTLLNT